MNSENSHDNEQLHLPVLLRSNPLREKFPYCSHLGLDRSVYENRVAWAKMTGFAPWPSRLATEEEIKTMLSSTPNNNAVTVVGSGGGLEMEIEDCKEQVCMYFLGSHQVGLVKRQQLEMDFVGKFAENSAKCTTKQFLMGLEEADGFVLREVFKEGCGSCMVCGGKDSPNRIILCDRCNSELHLDCLRPSIASVPEGMWMCPICVVEAPLTYQLESKRVKEQLMAPPTITTTTTAAATTTNNNNSSSAQKQTRRRPESEVAGGAAATPSSTGSSQYKRPKPLATAPAVSGSKWSAEEDAVLWSGITNNLSFQEICSKMDRSYSGCVHRHKELLRKNYQAPANILQLVQQHHQNHMQQQLQPRAPAATYSSFATTTSAAPTATTEPKRGNGASTSKTPTPPLMNSAALAAAAADATTSQLSKLLSIAQMPTMHREPARTCFACQQTGGGEMLACGDTICGKWFHPFCLGSRLPEDLEEQWFCPWHHCALCPLTAATPPALFAKKPVHHSTIAPISLQGSCQLVDNNNSLEGSKSHSTIKFARCIACPLALCDEHLHAPWDSHLVQRVPHADSHFFLCERCDMHPTPLGKSLDSLLSQALHKRGEAYADTLAKRPGQQMISTCAAPELAQTLLSERGGGTESTMSARPLSCGEVQALVRQNRLTTVIEFEKAIGDMANTLHTVYKWMHPALAQSCRKFHAQVLELVRVNSIELAALEKNWARFPNDKTAMVYSSKPVLRGITPWETYERFPAIEPSPDELEYGEAGKQDPHQTFAYLFQALESARLVAPVAETAMEPLLTPTQFEIDDLFEAHSASLRASLTSQARLRSEVNRVFASYQAGQETILELHKQLAETKQALVLAQQQPPANLTNHQVTQ
ncbi:hypothetical protein BASA81_012502 [Batrachochytrium salamandrivorans]|nr:hypothetical protein BASA81_012502 [Batrachochytrium salamandrivorans]